jgi:hypothetical protein
MSTDQTEIAWTWDGETVRVGVERTGDEPTVLLLPAMSSISTRAEMRPLAAWCRDQGCGRTGPNPVWGQAVRT